MEDFACKKGLCPRVSIITIVLNGVDVIGRTMESVLCQSYPEIEYIMIDGGSTDGTVALLQKERKCFAHFLSEPDLGVADAFNKGITLAQGDIIGLINAGDWYEPETVGRVVETFQRSPAPGVVCGQVQFWKNGWRQYRCGSVPALLNREMTIAHPTCFVLASCYRRYGLFDINCRFAMDYELLLRLYCKGVEFVALDHVLANMEQGGISENQWGAALRETHAARKRYLPGSFFSSSFYLGFLLAKRGVRRLLERLGCDSLIRLYREKMAFVKKHRT